MKRRSWSLWVLVICAVCLLVACDTGGTDSGSSETDGDEPEDRDDSDGDAPEDGDEPDGDEPDNPGPECWVVESSEPISFVSGLQGSEGIAFREDGRLFVSTKRSLLEVAPDGTTSVFAELVNPLGIASDAQGNLMVADFGETFKDGDLNGFLVRVSQDGGTERLAEGLISNPNFVTRTPWGTYLVSDDLVPEIWELTQEGDLALWSEQVSSPNGMVFSADGGTLFVASTFEDGGPIYAISIVDRQPGEVRLFASLGTGAFNDGLALDEEGRLYVAANGAGKIVRLDEDGNAETVAEGLLTPASLAFGEGEDFDPCSIYITELLGSTVWRIPLGVRGQPLFR